MSSSMKSSKIATVISYKLTRTNSLLWKAQVLPILHGVQLYGYLDGTTPAPVAKLIIEIGAGVKESDNLAYTTWFVQDQAIVGALLSSVMEDVLTQLTRCSNTSK